MSISSEMMMMMMIYIMMQCVRLCVTKNDHFPPPSWLGPLGQLGWFFMVFGWFHGFSR